MSAWACSSCTFINSSPYASACEICEMSRPKQQLSATEPSAKERPKERPSAPPPSAPPPYSEVEQGSVTTSHTRPTPKPRNSGKGAQQTLDPDIAIGTKPIPRNSGKGTQPTSVLDFDIPTSSTKPLSKPRNAGKGTQPTSVSDSGDDDTALEPLNIPSHLFDKARPLANELADRYSKLKIIVPSHDDDSESVQIGGPKGPRRKAIAELSKCLGMEVHIGVPTSPRYSHRALLLNSAPTDFPELRKHIGTLNDDWDVMLCVPNDDLSTTDRASLTGGTHEVEDALEELRLLTQLPILPTSAGSGAVQSTSGIDKVIIFHDGENCHCGGNVNVDKIYTEFIEAIENILGYSPDVRIKRVVWKMYITNGKNVPPMYHPSEATQSHLRNMGVDTVTAGEKKGDVDTRLMKGVEDLFEDTREGTCAGASTQLFVICSGDSDFSQQLRSAKGMGFRTMIAHGGRLKPGFDTHADFVWSGWAKLRDSAMLNGHLPVVSSTPHVPTTPTFAFKSKPMWHVDIPMNHKYFGSIIKNAKMLQSDYDITLHTFDKKILRTEHPLPISGEAHDVQRCMVELEKLVSLGRKVHVIPNEREQFETALRGSHPPHYPPTTPSSNPIYTPASTTHVPAPITRTIPCEFAQSLFFLKYQRTMILDKSCFKYDDSVLIKRAHSYIELQCTSNDTLVELERAVREALDEQRTEQCALVLPPEMSVRNPLDVSLRSIAEKYSVVLSAEEDMGTCNSPLLLASADVRTLANQSQHAKNEVMSRLQVFTLVGSTTVGSRIDRVKLDLFREEEVAIAPFGDDNDCDEAAYLLNGEVQRTIQDRFLVKVRVQKERGVHNAPNNALPPELNNFARQLQNWLNKQHSRTVMSNELAPFYKDARISQETKATVKVFGLKNLVRTRTHLKLSAEDTAGSHFLIRLAPTTVSTSNHTQRRPTSDGTANGSALSPELHNFAKQLQSWLNKQHSRKVLSTKLQGFYKEAYISQDTRDAVKVFGLKNLVHATSRLSARDIDGNGDYWIRPVSSTIPIPATVATTVPPSSNTIAALEIVGLPKHVSKALQFLLSITAVPVAACTLAADRSSVERVKSLRKFFHEYTKDYDGDVPDPVILRMQLNGKQLSSTNWGEASAGGSLTCRLLCCATLDDRDATKLFCDSVVPELKKVALTFTTKEFHLSATLAKEAKDKRWCEDLKRTHNLLNVFVLGASKFAETRVKLWRMNITHQHPRIGRMVGSKFSNIIRLQEKFLVTFPTLSGGRHKDSNHPIQIRGKAKDVRKCMAYLTTTLFSQSPTFKVDVIGAEKKEFSAELNETELDATGPLVLSGSADTVDDAIQALQDLELGNEQSTVSVAWPNHFGWLKDDPSFRLMTNEVTRYCKSVGVQCKHNPTPHTLVRLNGLKQPVAECENRFQELTKNTRKAIVTTPFELTKQEFAYVTADKYSVINHSLKKARTCKFYVGCHKDDASGMGSNSATFGSAKCILKAASAPNTPANVTIEVHVGSILAPELDVRCIVNAANVSLQHAGGIARVISEAAGKDQLAKECEAKLRSRTLGPGDCVMTSSCQLVQTSKIKNIAHLVAPIFQKSAVSGEQHTQYCIAVQRALELVDGFNLESIAIPLVGSGIYSWPNDEAARLIVNTVVSYIQTRKWSGKLSRVVFVDTDPSKAELLSNTLKVACNGSVVPTHVTVQRPTIPQHQWYWHFPDWPRSQSGQVAKEWMEYDADQNVQIETRYVELLANPKRNDTTVHIVGDLNGKRSDGKKAQDAKGAEYVVDLLRYKQINTFSNFERGVTRSLSAVATLQPIYDPSVKTPKVRVSTRDHSPLAFPAVGFQILEEADVTNVTPSPQGRVNTVMLLSLDPNGIKWVMDETKKWIQEQLYLSNPITVKYLSDIPFEDYVSAATLIAHRHDVEITDVDKCNETFRIKSIGECAKVETEVLHEINRMTREYKTNRDAPPKCWEVQDPDQPIQVFEVAQNSHEFTDVKNRLVRNEPGRAPFPYEVEKVERIQHQELWKEYCHSKETIRGRNKGNANEMLDLKHGTQATSPSVIIQSDHGIDTRYSEAGMYGRGAYFAELAAYSHQGYKHTVAPGRFQLFICRVLAGNAQKRDAFAESDLGRIRHPDLGYDSVNGPVSVNPEGGQYMAYIVYEKHRCYPEYLVTYTKK